MRPHSNYILIKEYVCISGFLPLISRLSHPHCQSLILLFTSDFTSSLISYLLLFFHCFALYLPPTSFCLKNKGEFWNETPSPRRVLLIITKFLFSKNSFDTFCGNWGVGAGYQHHEPLLFLIFHPGLKSKGINLTASSEILPWLAKAGRYLLCVSKAINIPFNLNIALCSMLTQSMMLY